ncbi:MAG: ImuA family protein [Brevundimonas sp.]
MRNKKDELERLRDRLSAAPSRAGVPGRRLSLGWEEIDGHLGGGLKRGAVHEIFAEAGGEAQSADGFALGLALRLQAPALVWALERRALPETGLPYGAGLKDWGLDPAALILVQVRDAAQLLAAGEEALASGAAPAVILSGWGEAKALTLTASRRLAFAAQKGRATCFFVRAGADPAPSAAETRWSVAAAPSTALDARAPGRPAFTASLQRSRAGAPPRSWILEWDRETRSFAPPAASGGLVSLPRHRPAGAGAGGVERAA